MRTTEARRVAIQTRCLLLAALRQRPRVTTMSKSTAEALKGAARCNCDACTIVGIPGGIPSLLWWNPLLAILADGHLGPALS